MDMYFTRFPDTVKSSLNTRSRSTWADSPGEDSVSVNVNTLGVWNFFVDLLLSVNSIFYLSASPFGGFGRSRGILAIDLGLFSPLELVPTAFRGAFFPNTTVFIFWLSVAEVVDIPAKRPTLKAIRLKKGNQTFIFLFSVAYAFYFTSSLRKLHRARFSMIFQAPSFSASFDLVINDLPSARIGKTSAISKWRGARVKVFGCTP